MDISITTPITGAELTSKLREVGAHVIPHVFDQNLCAKLVQDSRSYLFEMIPGVPGEHATQKRITVAEVPDTSSDPFQKVSRAIEEKLHRLFSEISAPLFSIPLDLRSIVLYRYDELSKGMGRHRDYEGDINLVVILSLSGSARFEVYPEQGNQQVFEVRTGDLCIIRAPGFDSTSIRPLHAVVKKPGERIILVLRQTII